MRYIDKYDLVVGYRPERKDKKLRIFYSWLYNLALRVLLHIPYRDIDCAFKLCKKRVIDKAKPFTTIRSADPELLCKALALGFTVKQIPVTNFPRIRGVSEAEKRRGFITLIKPKLVFALVKEVLFLRREIKKIKKSIEE